ncbi:MAG: hypothetical protein ACRDF6_13400, partial [bacterium]
MTGDLGATPLCGGAFLVGLRNRISVMWDRFWAYPTFRGGTHLIVIESQRMWFCALNPTYPP